MESWLVLLTQMTTMYKAAILNAVHYGPGGALNFFLVGVSWCHTGFQK